MRRRIAAAVVLLLGLSLAYVYVVKQPSNTRDWEYGMDTLAGITIDASSVRVQHVRDFEWSADGPRSSNFVDRRYDVDRLTQVWFVEEPFTLGPLGGFEGVAHTYFVFDFSDQPPVAVSVEARRERGESFDALQGLLNEFELIYIWGTERDLTGSRAVREGNQLFMYPLVGSMTSARTLFLHLAEATRQLETGPRFYNTLTSNCTNELAKVANTVKPGTVPPNVALVFPGFSDEVLYDLGFFPHDLPLATLRARSYISELVKANVTRDDFSSVLRTALRAAQSSS
jgi:hypothetical protein